MFSTEAVKAGFNRAASSYEEHALLQKNVLRRLLEIMGPLLDEQHMMLDAGCGTGYLTDFLPTGRWNIIQLDIAYAMCQHALERNHSIVLNADMERLPFPDRMFDTAISSLTLQWINQKRHAFKEMHRVLKPGGFAAITTFGPSTLHELKQAFESVDTFPHVSEFPTLIQCVEEAQQAGFDIRYCETMHERHYFPDVVSVIQNLRATGATNKTVDRRRGLTAPRKLAEMQRAYIRYFSTPLGVPASWEIYYLVLHKSR